MSVCKSFDEFCDRKMNQVTLLKNDHLFTFSLSATSCIEIRQLMSSKLRIKSSVPENRPNYD